MSRALGLSDRFWLNIQLDYDIEVEIDRHRRTRCHHVTYRLIA
jgi:plasmid maintenance system antidote protein VapI